MHASSKVDDAAPARSLAGIGRVLLWKGGSVWIGRDAGQVHPHSHHAIQITLAPNLPVRIRGGTDDTWRETSAALVMPDRPHQFDGCGQPVAMVFVEPETLAGRALTNRYGQQNLWLISDGCLDAHGADDALIATAQRLVEQLAEAPFGDAAVDPRIANVLDRIRDRPDGEMSLTHAAAIAHLSPSRFRHLFVAQTGISFRAYLLWARVGDAVARGMAGGSWTDAAQQAGFADSAHLSRTCRRMFGVAPTMLVREDQAVARETAARRKRGGLASA